MKRLAAFAVGCFPQNAPESRPVAPRLAETIVTATRHDKLLFDAPFTAYRIDGEDAQQSGLVSRFNDALAGVPSLLTQKTSQGLGSPFLWGFGGYNTLILVVGLTVRF